MRGSPRKPAQISLLHFLLCEVSRHLNVAELREVCKCVITEGGWSFSKTDRQFSVKEEESNVPFCGKRKERRKKKVHVSNKEL